MNQLNISTPRLELLPLSLRQLESLLENIESFERKTGYVYLGEPLVPPISTIFQNQADLLIKDPNNMIYHTVWMIARKKDRTILGSILAKNHPNSLQQIEIGYGLSPAFSGKGYMTEAVIAFTSYLRSLPDVLEVLAQTLKTNIASHRVLEKSRFYVYKKTKLYFWWKQYNE